MRPSDSSMITGRRPLKALTSASSATLRAIGCSMNKVDATSRRREWELTGRTSGNTVVNFPGPPQWLGRFMQVVIRRAGPNSVWGEPVGEPA